MRNKAQLISIKYSVTHDCNQPKWSQFKADMAQLGGVAHRALKREDGIQLHRLSVRGRGVKSLGAAGFIFDNACHF